MLVTHLLRSLIIVWLVVGSSCLQAQSWQDMQQLQIAADSWLAQQLDASVGRYEVRWLNLDPRLRLDACLGPVVVEQQSTGELHGRINVKVSCPDQGWFVYLGAQVAHFLPVVVAQNDLPRRTRLAAPLLTLQEVDVSKLRGDYFTSIHQLQGVETRNRVRAGEVISSTNLIAAAAVNKGEQIVIVATNAKISVRMLGEALDNGKIGEQIRVRNLQSGRVIRALVVARGRVEVNY